MGAGQTFQSQAGYLAGWGFEPLVGVTVGQGDCVGGYRIGGLGGKHVSPLLACLEFDPGDASPQLKPCACVPDVRECLTCAGACIPIETDNDNMKMRIMTMLRPHANAN